MADAKPSSGLGAQLAALWKRMSPRRRVALVAAGLGTLLFVGYLGLSGPDYDYQVLYAGMSPEDAHLVVGHLRAKAIPYRLVAGGTAIEVPAGQVHEARIDLAAQGYPRGGGVGFEIFDQQTFGASSFVEQINYRRALQGELSRTISALDVVESARVHVAVGRRSVFREADEPPSASVTLKLRAGRSLSDNQVRGITHLVSSSVDGLSADRVVIVDEKGNVLSAVDDAETRSLEAQAKLEEELTYRVKKMVERVVGRDHAEVVVTAEMDQHRVDQTEEIYDKDRYAVRSEARTIEGTGDLATTGGIAGARGNLPGAPPPTTGGESGTKRLSETRNYEVNRLVRHTVGPQAKIKRLHVAVLVDYVPEAQETASAAASAADQDAADKGNAGGEKGKDKEEDEEEAAPKAKMVPRAQEELDHIAAIARQAAGVDPARGDEVEVRSVSFHPEEGGEPDGLTQVTAATSWPLSKGLTVAITTAAALAMFALVAVLLLRGRKGALDKPEVMRLPAPIADVEAAITGKSNQLRHPSAPPLELPVATGPSLTARINEAVRKDARQAAGVLKAWLADGASSQ